MPIQAILFDLDETLLDGSQFELSILRTCEAIATRYGLDADRLAQANRDCFRDYWPEIFERWTFGGIDGPAVTAESWSRALRACGCYDESIARFAGQTHLQFGRESYRLFDDVRELFIAVRAAGVPMALITNGPPITQRDKLQALGIEKEFHAVVISGEVGIAKPDARVFEMVLADRAFDRRDMWHVGDNLDTDVAGANAASMTSVWINRHGRVRNDADPVPDLEIRSLRDLIRHLTR